MAFFHIKFQNIPSLILFSLTDDSQFFGLEVSLSNILMTDLFCSNSRMVIFSKTEKNSYHSKHIKGLYIYDVQIEVGWVGRGGES